MPQNHKDMEILYEIDDLILKSENEIQKAMSLVELNVDNKKAFEQVFENIDLLDDKYNSLNDKLIKLVAISKISQLLNELEDNILTMYREEQ